jgi:HTH-type transcriptional regulator/antitoxin HigA
MTPTYEELLLETLPARITAEEQYNSLHSRFGELLGRHRHTKAEEKLMDLLGLLIQDYDRRHGLPPDDSTPAERLEFLLEHSGKAPADLLPVFGQRSHVNEALTGKRNISAAQARKLGQLFHVAPGLFI